MARSSSRRPPRPNYSSIAAAPWCSRPSKISRRSIDDESLDIDENSIMVLKGCGPKGYPGMAEVGNMPLPPKVLRKGITDMVRISDARMSGTAYGTVVLHVAPEAAAGGPLALVKTGDIIELDVPARKLHLDVSDAELAQRRAAWKAPESAEARLLQALRRARAAGRQGCGPRFPGGRQRHYGHARLSLGLTPTRKTPPKRRRPWINGSDLTVVSCDGEFGGRILVVAEAVLIRRNRRWFVHVLSLALLFAQLGMVVHASTHLKPEPHATPTQTQLCGAVRLVRAAAEHGGRRAHRRCSRSTFPTIARTNRAAAVSVPHRAFTAFRSRAPPVSF